MGYTSKLCSSCILVHLLDDKIATAYPHMVGAILKGSTSLFPVSYNHNIQQEPHCNAL